MMKSSSITSKKSSSGGFLRSGKAKKMEGVVTSSGVGKASIYHALVVIFLEFFAWGLLTSPMITVLNETFPEHTFLINGLIVGIKGLLSFLSAPLIGALSDIWGRKFFLLITVFFTCVPIPLMKINTWWYFAMISISGVFAVTFSVVFAYVADVTDEADRSSAYGLVSATFAASLVTSPALGAYLEQMYSEEVVIALATAVAILDVLFIMVAVPESLPDKCKPPASRGITLEQVDPFQALRKMSKDKTVLMICVTVFLSYLPEAGQYSCFFVYLRLVMNFSKEEVALFIATIGILSVIAQTGLLTLLMRTLGNKHTIMIGLLFEMLQLMWYGFGSKTWMMWAAGVLASISSITYPAISSYVSMHADADKQGLVQGMITGMRGLCNGLGPAMFGLIFSLFHVDLNEKDKAVSTFSNSTVQLEPMDAVTNIIPGPPFVFGALLVILALMVAAFIADTSPGGSFRSSSSSSNSFINSHYNNGSSILMTSSGPLSGRRLSDKADGIYKKSDDEEDEELIASDREYTIPLMLTDPRL
ncbi:hippocampus abundant transcript 1 protein [Lepeophtheirus salmonis]|uniref:Major facilitator superfamily (MFS) profile domain-containing protein n=1 Tax=Lepeophtheirus salmonis TaxID=72036 RepID=A0A0K2TXX5_LEPSM|nr:hippocampus abundant transcript 1 protein-like [Lepeophtheirus salmonis]